MKITKVECLVASRSTAETPDVGNTMFIVTPTDEGLRGIGEAYSVGPDIATKEWVGYFAEQIVGHDPTRIEYLWAMMYQGARFPPGSSGLAALSGIDQSLWDITARSYGIPAYDLLGGRYRDRIRGYLDIALGDSDGKGEERAMTGALLLSYAVHMGSAAGFAPTPTVPENHPSSTRSGRLQTIDFRRFITTQGSKSLTLEACED